MIHQLTAEATSLERIRPLFKENSRHPILNGILAGHNKGRIFVDDPYRPACALVWAEQEIFYLIGEPQESFVTSLSSLIKDVIAPEAERIGDAFFQVELMPEEKWQPVVERCLQAFLPKRYERVTFAFDQERFRKMPHLPIPDGVSVERITLELLADESFGEVLNNINDFWQSPELFVEKGIGYAVRTGGEVVCSCLTAFAAETDVEVGISTYSRADRGKGYARLAVQALLDECLRQGRMPHWKTEDFRLPSIKLAEKVGFTNRRSYYAYVFVYNEQDNLVFTAYHRFRYFGDIAEAHRLLEQALTLGNLNGWHHFLLACGYSLVGQTEQALEHVKRAVELGWKDVSDLRYDLDLANLRNTEQGRVWLEEFERGLS